MADAVKDLAQRSETASNDIGEQIDGVQSTSDACVNALAGIQKTVSTVAENNIALTTATEQQASTTRCIATAVDETNAAVATVAHIIASVNENTEATKNTVAHLTERAVSLAQLADQLQNLAGNDQQATAAAAAA